MRQNYNNKNNNTDSSTKIADSNNNDNQSKAEINECGVAINNGFDSEYNTRLFVDSTPQYHINNNIGMNSTYCPAYYDTSLLDASPDMKSSNQNLSNNANCMNLFASSIIPQMNSYPAFPPSTSSLDFMEQKKLMINVAQQNLNRSNGKINTRQDNLCTASSYTADQQVDANRTTFSFSPSTPTSPSSSYGNANIASGLPGLAFPNVGATASNSSVLGSYFQEQMMYGSYTGVPNHVAYNFGDFCMMNGFNDANNNNASTTTMMDMKHAAAAIAELTAHGMPFLASTTINSQAPSAQTSNADEHSSSSNVQSNISKRVVSSSPALANTGSTMSPVVNPNDVMSPMAKIESAAIPSIESKMTPKMRSSFDFFNGSAPFSSAVPTINSLKMEQSAYPMPYILNSSEASVLSSSSTALFNSNLAMIPSSSSVNSDDQNAKDFSQAAAQLAAYSSQSIASEGPSSYRNSGPGASTLFYTPPSGSGFCRANGNALRYFPQHRFNPPYKTGPGSNNVRVRTLDKYRTVYSETQRCHLEAEYETNNFVTAERKAELSTLLQLTERQIKIWFQNRRAKKKKEKGNRQHI